MSRWRVRSSSRVLSICLILALLILASGFASARPRDAGTSVALAAKLTSSDAAAGDRFGWSVAISGDTVVASAAGDEPVRSAYVFERDAGGAGNWGQVAKLTPSDGAEGGGFGMEVTISGDTVVVGAGLDDDNGENSGSAYLFEKAVGGWTDMTETAELIASDGAEGDYFGWSVSISGDILIVGAPKHAGGGSAYLFERDADGPGNWGEVATLFASDGAAISWFGRTVAVSGDTAVAGSRADEDHGGEQSGAAYVFEKPGAGWTDMTETAKLTASDGVAYDVFAEWVAISGDIVVASAGGDNANGIGSGAAYLFEKPGTGWTDMTKTAKLTASDGAEFDGFGSSVSISGAAVVVGARGDDDGGESSGSVYLFRRPGAGWTDTTETAKITASDGAERDYFGWSTSISGGAVVAGSSADDDDGEDSGSAYVFTHFTPAAWVYVPVVLRGVP